MILNTLDNINNFSVIHYGATEYIPNKIKPIKNDNWCKPRGGLWCSPTNSNWGWKDWCKIEHFRDCDERNSFKLKFKPNSKIILINSLSDLINLPKVESEYDCLKHPDFELLATLCDVIWLTEIGQNETHLSYPNSLYGWDCESVLILNNKCAYQCD